MQSDDHVILCDSATLTARLEASECVTSSEVTSTLHAVGSCQSALHEICQQSCPLHSLQGRSTLAWAESLHQMAFPQKPLG